MIAIGVMGLEGADYMMATFLRDKYRVEVFNSGLGKSKTVKSNIKIALLSMFDNKCAVCETASNISVAHILKREEDCKKLKIPWDYSNFLVLCGTDGEQGTCHHLFDNFQMSFVHSKATSQWVVIGGGAGRHAKTVILASSPHKRALHAHFTRCVVTKSLVGFQVEDLPVEGDLEVSDESNEIVST